MSYTGTWTAGTLTLASDGCFYGNDEFMRGLIPKAEDLEIPFAMEVFNMLEKEGKINNVIIDNMMNWQHSGFNIYCGLPVSPMDEEGVERLSQYIIRAPISQERITYIPENVSEDGVARVVYEGKTSGTNEIFTALDWLARLVTHIPNKGEQVVRYYGYYSNKSRGMRKKDNEDDKKVPDLVESDISSKAFHKNWARLIQKIYHVDPLLCPKCGNCMKIISFIEDETTIKKILKHLNLWMPQNHDPPREKITHFRINVQSHRGFEWWEAIHNTSFQQNNSEDIYQMPYEDEYSQITPFED